MGGTSKNWTGVPGEIFLSSRAASHLAPVPSIVMLERRRRREREKGGMEREKGGMERRKGKGEVRYTKYKLLITLSIMKTVVFMFLIYVYV